MAPTARQARDRLTEAAALIALAAERLEEAARHPDVRDELAYHPTACVVMSGFADVLREIADATLGAPEADCDCCGKPAALSPVIAYGIETFACEGCRA